MTVLSLFDGMSCGQIALRELKIKIETYYASEIDKFAIAQTKLNFPETVQIGDVRNIDARKLGHIDLIIGGSPCQSFSFAGKRAGMATKEKEKIYTLDRYLELKKTNFEFEGQSYLFWEYVRILAEVREDNPNVLFMLENVEMGKQWEAVINQALGIKGMHVNSALVSAQVRKRIYWTNIRTFQADLFDVPESAIPQPKDRGILLKHILDDEVPDRFYLKPETIEKLLQHKQRNKANGNGFGTKFHQGGKMTAVTVKDKGMYDLVCVKQRGHDVTDRRIRRLNPSRESGRTQPYQQDRIYDPGGQAPTLMNGHGGQTINVLVGGDTPIRRLTPAECARLQTIPDWYKWQCSKTQQYKMLGNGWTIEVIKHILSFLPNVQTKIEKAMP